MLRKKLKLDPIPSSPSSSSSWRNDRDVIRSVSEEIIIKEINLSCKLDRLTFEEPVSYVYNPLRYACDVRNNYLRRYCDGTRKIMFLGINPGPNGMVQTGVPFGEIKTVREWLNIDGVIDKPELECPKRPILGLNNVKVSEISGKRFWNLFRNLCTVPEHFFANCYVHNYCPLAFLKENGNNMTPNELRANSIGRQLLESYCNEHLLEMIELLNIETIIAVGRYAERCCKNLLKTNCKYDVIRLLYMHHPSPRVPNKRPWHEIAEEFLNDNDLMRYFRRDDDDDATTNLMNHAN